jgi:CYTH domain-containing protein
MEIERKFLVKNLDFKNQTSGTFIAQGYLGADLLRTIRVRIYGDKAYLTIKSKTVGISRDEYEYDIPVKDAKAMLNDLCAKPLIEKNRYEIKYQGKIWEVDEFLGENTGLYVAEIELASESEAFEKPQWVGEEVSGDPKYFNSNLVKFPFSKWKNE